MLPPGVLPTNISLGLAVALRASCPAACRWEQQAVRKLYCKLPRWWREWRPNARAHSADRSKAGRGRQGDGRRVARGCGLQSIECGRQERLESQTSRMGSMSRQPRGFWANLFGAPPPHNRFSLEELQFLHGVLLKNPIVSDANRDTVVEVLRSMAELVIW